MSSFPFKPEFWLSVREFLTIALEFFLAQRRHGFGGFLRIQSAVRRGAEKIIYSWYWRDCDRRFTLLNFKIKYNENEYFDGEIPDREKQFEEEIAIDEEQAWWQQYEFEGYGELKSEKWDLEGVNYEFKALEEFMFINLRNRRIYIMGNVANFRIYVVGRTKEDDWLGISPKAVWT